MSEFPQTLTKKIDRIEAEGGIEVGAVDFTINDPDAVRASFEPHLVFAQTVEIEVPTTAQGIRTLLPNMHSELARFLDAWEAQETQHGRLLGIHLYQLGLNNLPIRDKVPPSLRLAGKIAGFSPGMHNMVELIYAHEGSLVERETSGFYGLWSEGLHAIGEPALAETLVRPIGKQEAGHLGVYRQIAKETWPQLSSYQQWLARELITRTYMPPGVRVGSRGQERRSALGHAILLSSGGNEEVIRRVTDPVERLAAELFEISVDDMPPFLRKRYLEAIDEYRASQAIADASEPHAA